MNIQPFWQFMEEKQKSATQYDRQHCRQIWKHTMQIEKIKQKKIAKHNKKS